MPVKNPICLSCLNLRNAIAGHGAKLSYLRARLQIVLRTPYGLEISAHRWRPAAGDGARVPEVGTTVRVTWPVAHLRVFPE